MLLNCLGQSRALEGKREVPAFKLCVPVQLSEVQFIVYLTDCSTQRLCCEESEWGVEGAHKERGPGPASPTTARPAIAFPDWDCWSGTKGGSFAITRQLLSPFLLTLWFLSSSLSAEGEGSGGFGLCRGGEPPPNALKGGKEFSWTFHFGHV